MHARHPAQISLLRGQTGFSLIELMAVLLVTAVAMSIAIPKLKSVRDNGAHQQAQNTLETAWDDAQDFYLGERGTGQQASSTSSFNGFTAATAALIDPKLTWVAPAGTTAATFVPAAGNDRKVFIHQAANQTLALCASSPKLVFCKVDDGQTVSGRNGARYGASAVSAADAVSHACAGTSGQARAAQSQGNPTTCTLESGAAGTDSDNDGIADTADACPAAPSFGSANGCPAAPASTVAPAISGSAVQGQTLSATSGTWSGSPTAYAYQWRRCDSAANNCTDIAAATSSSYVLTATDAGARIRVQVSASNAGGTTSATSAATSTVLPPPPANTVAPVVSVSRAAVGRAFSTTNGTWTNTPTSYSYQWQRCTAAASGCSNVAGATSSSYTALSADLGQYLQAQVTATNAGGSTTATTTSAGPLINRYPAAMLDLSPLEWWRFNANATPQTSVALTSTGTVSFAGASLLAGDSDLSADYNTGAGGQLSQTTHPFAFLGTQAFTTVAWVRPVAAASTIIMSAGACPGGAPRGWSLSAGLSGGLFRFGFSRAVGVVNEILTGYTYAANTTYFVAGTYDGTNIRLYVNGNLIGTLASGSLPSSGQFNIGSSGLCATGGVVQAGRIDEPAVWNRALNATEISGLYSAGT